ncbi:MAG TPA: alkaline phosphatase family protein [Terriglobales bacterium]|nr:alkaline phosphatase family protein [Terriglobales bacterium]
MRLSSYLSLFGAIATALMLAGCQGMSGKSGPTQFQLTVTDSGTGTGTVTSAPAGINCGKTCSASFQAGTTVVLTAAPAANTKFTGWSGACSGTGTCSVTINATTMVTAAFSGPPPVQLTVTEMGKGTGTVTSSPAGINCPTTCTANFPTGTAITLTAQGSVAAWSGCSANGASCTLTLSKATTVTATFNASLQSINHIVFLAQENRSFDHYFGALREYWAQNGFSDQAIDGLPQFNIPAGAAPTNPGCDPTSQPPNDCNAGAPGSTPVPSFHLLTQCIENPSPSWNESHVDRNLSNQISPTATMDGFVQTAADNSRRNPGYLDVNGFRAMGFYDGTDLNYYYFMASSFATSDRWFSPVMSRTDPNRMYLVAATSQGHVYPLNQTNSPPLTAPPIFEELQQHGISWKIYVNPKKPDGTSCADTDGACLIQLSTILNFSYAQTIKSTPSLLQNIQSTNIYLSDAKNGTLPSVALIDPAFSAGLDEHPTVDVQGTPTRIQAGAGYVSTLINTLMFSPSWKDSVFVLTFDEGGSLFDHVGPFSGDSTVPAPPNPDGIPPRDMLPGDVCTSTPGAPTCDFTITGFRVPLVVVSPFTKKHYVSHTPTDYTAILKLIETRFNVPHLTNRDAWAMDMTEFFDFTNVPWATPPSPPKQNTSDACDLSAPVP